MIFRYLTGLLLLMIQCLAAAGQKVTITSRLDDSRTVMPGTSLSVPFLIKNNSGAILQMRGENQSPEKIRLLEKEFTLRLQPGESNLRILTLILPPATAPGYYTIRMNISDSIHFIHASGEARFLVGEKTGLNIEEMDHPGYQFAGQAVEARFIASNEGNSSKTFRFACIPGQLTGDSVATLSPGDKLIIKTITTIPANIRESGNIIIQVQGSEISRDTVLARACAVVRGIPVAAGPEDCWQRFPVTVTMGTLVRLINSSPETRFQGEISGSSTLDEQGRQRMDFCLRLPGQNQFSALGQQENCFLRYSGNHLMAHLGDDDYSFSVLTDRRFGRGFKTEWSAGRLRFGGYYQKPRYYPSVKEVSSAWITWQPDNRSRLKAGALRKTYAAGDTPEATFFSINPSFHLQELFSLDLEVSSSFQERRTGLGFFASVSGKIKDLSYNGQWIQAGAAFPGMYSNTRFASYQISYDLIRPVSIVSGATLDGRPQALDTLYGIKPSGYQMFFGFNIQPGPTFSASGFYTVSERRDQMPQNLFEYQERAFRMTLTSNIGRFQPVINAGIGRTNNLLSATIRTTWSTEGSLVYMAGQRLIITLFSSYINGNRYSAERSGQWYAGGGLSLNAGNRLSLSVNYRNAFSPEEYYQDRSLSDLSVRYRINERNEIGIMVQNTLRRMNLGETDLSALISYSSRIGIPVRRISDSGTVTGLFLKPDGRGYDGIPVFLAGKTTVTNRQGEFRFDHIRPGSYLLTVDPSAMQSRETTDQLLPLEITVDPLKENRLVIRAVEKCSLGGKFRLIAASATGSSLHPFEGYGKLMIVAEASLGNERLRQLVRADGSFSFEGLRPGTWTLKFFLSAGNDQYLLEQREQQCILLPGDRQIIEPVLRQKTTKIRYLQQELRVENH